MGHRLDNKKRRVSNNTPANNDCMNKRGHESITHDQIQSADANYSIARQDA